MKGMPTKILGRASFAKLASSDSASQRQGGSYSIILIKSYSCIRWGFQEMNHIFLVADILQKAVVILQMLFLRTLAMFWGYFIFANLVHGQRPLSSVSSTLACEQQTHFRSSLLSLRKIACEQQTHFRSSEGEKRRPGMRLLFAGYFDLFLLWNLLPFFRQHSWAIGPLSLRDVSDRDVSDPCYPVPSLRLTAITIIFPLNTLKRNVLQIWSIPAGQC